MSASDLAEVLNAQPPASIEALPEPVRARLVEQILKAREIHRTLGEQSVAAAVDGVPLAVRGIVRKALLG